MILRGGHVDRIGLFDSPWPDTLIRWTREGYPVQAAEGEKRQPLDPVDHFEFDMCEVGGWFDVFPLRGFEEVVEETEEWITKRNGSGALLKYWKKRSGAPEYIDFRMTGRDVWAKDYRAYLLEVDKKRLDIGKTAAELEKRKEQGLWTFYGHQFLWENARQSMGDLCLYQSLLTDPDWIRDYNRVYTDFFKAHYRVLIEGAGKPDGVWIYEDIGYKNGLVCSPRILEELYFPYYKELVDFFHSYDLPVVLHSCGGIEKAIPMIIEAGFDAINPMEPKAGCNPLQWAKRYKDNLAFIGGLDSLVLETGDKELIRREIMQLVKGMKSLGARYIFGSDHSISPNVSYEDYQYALEIYRENMMC